MRVAFVSREYAGTADGGGIGTYVRNAAAMFAARGHQVEVFTSGARCESREISGGLRIHTVATDGNDFTKKVRAPFSRQHAHQRFDVVEAAEYNADAADIVGEFPELPLVVKLHTPGFVVGEINSQALGLRQKARFFLGGLRRGRVPQPYWIYDAARDRERAFALAANEVTSPSRAMLDYLSARWALPSATATCIPNVFIPPPELLSLPPGPSSRTIMFLGRLEVRKGVIDLARAVPLVLAAEPGAKFKCVGRSLPHPATGEDMRAHLGRMLSQNAQAVEFVDGVAYDRVPAMMEQTAICVFPSLWENFPNVCLEAMAAARGVIGSSAGGMAEMIEHGRTGLLVPPRDPKAIADAILALLRDPQRRLAMGRAARAHVLSAYSPEVIGPMQEASYCRAIERAKARRAA